MTKSTRIWSHLLKKSLMENFIFYAVIGFWNSGPSSWCTEDIKARNVHSWWMFELSDDVIKNLAIFYEKCYHYQMSLRWAQSWPVLKMSYPIVCHIFIYLCMRNMFFRFIISFYFFSHFSSFLRDMSCIYTYYWQL